MVYSYVCDDFSKKKMVEETRREQLCTLPSNKTKLPHCVVAPQASDDAFLRACPFPTSAFKQ